MSGTTQVPVGGELRVSDAVRSADGGGGRLQGGVARGSRVGATDGQGGGHLDYSFAAAWHPDGRVFATGNQDTATRVWDARHLGQSLAVLRGRMARFGRFASPATVGSSPPPNRRISSTCMTSSRDSPSRKPWITSEKTAKRQRSPQTRGALRGGGGSDVRVGARVPANETRKRRGGGVSWRATPTRPRRRRARCPMSRDGEIKSKRNLSRRVASPRPVPLRARR